MSTGVFFSVLAGMLTTLLNLGLGVFLLLLFYFRVKKREARRWDILFFALVSLGIALWGSGIIVVEIFGKSIEWLWVMMIYLERVGLAMYYVFFYYFALITSPGAIRKWWLYAVSGVPLLIMVVLFPIPGIGIFKYSATSVELVESSHILRVGSSIIAFLSYLLGFGVLVWKFIKAKETQKKILGFVLGGTILSIIIGNSFVLFSRSIVGNKDLWSYSFVLIFTFTIVFAISRYQLFHVRKIFAQILILLGVVASMFTVRVALNLRFGTESWGLITVLLVVFVIMAAFLIREVFIRTRKEIELSQIQQKLEETIETKNSFMSMASVQLRTPLSVIIGYLSVLLDNPEEAYEMNDATREGLERSYNGIIDDMASAREVNEGEFTLEITDEVNLRECIEDIVDTKQTFFEEQNTEVHTEYMGEDFTTYVDKSKLKEALNNLVDNAVYYGDGNVNIRIEQGGKTYKIAVEDNGVGLDPDEVNGLFDKFSRGEDSAKINPNGSGLGLYLAKTIADKHGGRIEVNSKGKGKGSTFTVVLPQREESVG